MKNLFVSVVALLLISHSALQAQELEGLTIRAGIDSSYVFGFDLRESRSAKGGIWNVRTGKPETPLSYTQMRNDNVDGESVIMLYREVVPGNHPLNVWETWAFREGRWIRVDDEGEEPSGR